MKKIFLSVLIAICSLLLLTVISATSSAHAESVLYATGTSSTSGGGTSALYIIDPLTGSSSLAWNLVGGVNVYNGGLAYDVSTDTLYANGTDNLSQDRLYTINRFTGDTTTIGSPGNNINLSSGGIAINPLNGVMYAVGMDGTPGTRLFTIDKSTGAATAVGTNGFPASYYFPYLYGIGFRSDGTLFANGLKYGSAESHLYTVDLSTGSASEVGSSGVALGRSLTYSGLAFSEDGTLLSLGSITGSTDGLYSINTLNGASTLLGQISPRFGVDGGIAFVPAVVVPEPVSSILFVTGGVFLAGRRLLRRKST